MKTTRWIVPTITLWLLLCLTGWTVAQEAPEAEQPSETAPEASASDPADTDVETPEGPAAKGLQIALFKPYQIHKPEISIRGFRWNVLYGLNENVSGLDMGIVNRVNDEFKGIQLGFYNEAQKAGGLQMGILNTAAQEARGLQLGIINHSANMNGIQVGLLYNSADTLKGVQIGLLNFTWNRKPVFFFPLINGSF